MTRVMIVAPMQREATALGRDAIAIGAGSRAAAALDARLAEGACDLVLIAGVCGGLDPSLAAGSVILGRSLLTADRPEIVPVPAYYDAARRALRRAGGSFVAASLLTVERPIGSRADRTDAWNTYGAGGVDMETYALAEVAVRRGVAWLAVRTVVDEAAASLPAALREWNGDTDDRAIAREALRNPREWLAYAKLALSMRRALSSLARAVPIVARAAESVVVTGDPRASASLEIPLVSAR